jgi:hypothetical protein
MVVMRKARYVHGVTEILVLAVRKVGVTIKMAIWRSFGRHAQVGNSPSMIESCLVGALCRRKNLTHRFDI